MDQRTAYMHLGLRQDSLSPNSHHSYAEPHDLSAPIVTSGSRFIMPVTPSPRPTPGASRENTSDVVDDVPVSSTPDLLSPNAASCTSSPDVPLTQKAFNHRLHALLQAILDQLRDERGANIDGSPGSDGECELWITPSQIDSEYHSHFTLRPCVTWPTNLDNYSDNDNVSSFSSSPNSLGVWASSPDDDYGDYGDEYAEAPLTRQNKRKHDESHDFLETDECDGYTTALEAKDSRAPKKAKLEAGSFTSAASSFRYQTSETASSRKLRSLSSTSSCFTSSVSTVINSPAPHFAHPILHPPADPPQVPRSRREIAEARIKALLTRETLYRVQDSLPARSIGLSEYPSDQQEDVFGIEPAFRRKVVQWILDVLPPAYLKTEDLYQHLACSEETRFHAMYLFSRFFLRMGDYDERRPQRETSQERRARREYTWDTAFCCLAISIKFYHDFLRPLVPIDARSFLAISPQFLSHDQFESLQRDVLDSFDYEILGVTPHAYFEELWDALPSLQEILKLRRSRRIVRNEMWERLQLAALQSDIMRFPVSLLTAAVLVEAIIVVFVDRYHLEEDGNNSSQSTDGGSRDPHRSRAHEDVKPISKDIVGLLGISHVDLRACRQWLSLVTTDRSQDDRP